MKKATAKTYQKFMSAHLTSKQDGRFYGKNVSIGGEGGASALHKAVAAALEEHSYVRVEFGTGQTFTVRRREGRA